LLLLRLKLKSALKIEQISGHDYRFNKKKTWNDVEDEVTDPEEVDLKKTDQI
jgi:hypothetical protein